MVSGSEVILHPIIVACLKILSEKVVVGLVLDSLIVVLDLYVLLALLFIAGVGCIVTLSV